MSEGWTKNRVSEAIVHTAWVFCATLLYAIIGLYTLWFRHLRSRDDYWLQRINITGIASRVVLALFFILFALLWPVYFVCSLLWLIMYAVWFVAYVYCCRTRGAGPHPPPGRVLRAVKTVLEWEGGMPWPVGCREMMARADRRRRDRIDEMRARQRVVGLGMGGGGEDIELEDMPSGTTTQVVAGGGSEGDVQQQQNGGANTLFQQGPPTPPPRSSSVFAWTRLSTIEEADGLEGAGSSNQASTSTSTAIMPVNAAHLRST
ncbi:hypothetical protein B0T22DRAFT_494060 [Podospora appendiculata]|uniref:Uncharacterized protein n=1 Tax=Podospora appendiculata TaxID=314037 RepID=A0AAE1C821_9PEZI|nr:hypothetical protein B0T22DRAFT_494060 [Podospora appendiculata]